MSAHEELRCLSGIDLASKSQDMRARDLPKCIIDIDGVERKLFSHPLSITMQKPSKSNIQQED